MRIIALMSCIPCVGITFVFDSIHSRPFTFASRFFFFNFFLLLFKYNCLHFTTHSPPQILYFNLFLVHLSLGSKNSRKVKTTATKTKQGWLSEAVVMGEKGTVQKLRLWRGWGPHLSRVFTWTSEPVCSLCSLQRILNNCLPLCTFS